MQLYSCKVRLAGSLYNEVFKPEVTVPEIYILKFVHGDDAVVDITPLRREAFDPGPLDDDGRPTKPVLRTEAAERERLMRLYDPNDRFVREKVFGVGQPLPQVIEGLEGVTLADPPPRKRAKVDDNPLAEMTA